MLPLVERVWGHDLRVEGVVVEHLEGLDNLGERLAEFGPGPGRRVGVLVDHLVTGSKETQLTQGLGPDVLVTGHPYIDVWEAVRPKSVGNRLLAEDSTRRGLEDGNLPRTGLGDTSGGLAAGLQLGRELPRSGSSFDRCSRTTCRFRYRAELT